MTNVEGVLARARQFLFVREAAGNKNAGRWVEAIQRIGGTTRGQPWCACFVFLVLGLWYDGVPPLTYTPGCDELLREAKAKGILFTDPEPGDLFLLLKSPTDAIHTGFVTEGITATHFGSIEGNASNPEAPPTREGFGVFERPVSHPKARRRGRNYVFIRYRLLS